MKSQIFLVIKCLVFCSYSYSQSSFATGEITDIRDGKKYQTISINETIWLSENMKFKTSNCHIISENENSSKSNGYYYPLEESEKVCPSGFRLPKESEWEEYVEVLMEMKNVSHSSIEYTQWSNKKGSGKAIKQPIENLTFFEEPNPLNLEPIGIIQGEKHLKDGAMSFWSRQDESNDKKYHLHIEGNTYSNHSHKHHIIARKKKKRKFLVRCVK